MCNCRGGAAASRAAATNAATRQLLARQRAAASSVAVAASTTTVSRPRAVLLPQAASRGVAREGLVRPLPTVGSGRSVIAAYRNLANSAVGLPSGVSIAAPSITQPVGPDVKPVPTSIRSGAGRASAGSAGSAVSGAAAAAAAPSRHMLQTMMQAAFLARRRA